MITQDTYQAIIDQLDDFTYTSMRYTPYEYVEDASVCIHTKDLILIKGYSKELSMTEIYFCVNDIQILLHALDEIKEPVYLQFVPNEHTTEFTRHGFTHFAHFREMYAYSFPEGTPIQILSLDEAKDAAAITRDCRLQSRGFLGETDSWAINWMQGKDPNADYCKYCAILGTKAGNTLTGMVAVALYSFDKPEGPTLWVREVCVKPEYQGQGYGKQLLAQALAYGAKYHAHKAFLMADVLNKNAISLYEKNGFTFLDDDGQIDMIRES
ncbi:GNAT family N-acetyltransferase [Anaerosporobacter faecicola]|uniref:GNAT family N-acetyltransferase n=1 Tax=Anaerosporobacter faecicola TaxID=2718714 RepID=UPI001439540F|nr:GNAT family N-acetyltransferase [Anaerosporobacter faecicola]